MTKIPSDLIYYYMRKRKLVPVTANDKNYLASCHSEVAPFSCVFYRNHCKNENVIEIMRTLPKFAKWYASLTRNNGVLFCLNTFLLISKCSKTATTFICESKRLIFCILCRYTGWPQKKDTKYFDLDTDPFRSPGITVAMRDYSSQIIKKNRLSKL